MSSSSTSLRNHAASTTAEEHLINFRQLPFHIYFTNPYSPLPPHLTSVNFSNFFRQISVGIIPVSPPPQILRLVRTEFHYRYIVDQTPITTHTEEENVQEDNSITSSSSNSFSSIPDLIPISHTPNDPLSSHVDISSDLSRTAPPSYLDSEDRPPAYHTIRSRELVLRRIRILESNSSEIRNQILEDHHREISSVNSTTRERLNTHNSTFRDEIRLLEDSLDI